jgi:hypothetical protein
VSCQRGRRCRAIAIGRSCSPLVSALSKNSLCSRDNPHQKLFGLYLLATVMMASFESSSTGYTPYAALGKCSLTYAPKLFKVDLLRTTMHQLTETPTKGPSQDIHKIRVRALEGMALGTTGFLRGMVELEAGRALDVVVPSVSQRVVRADYDRLATSRQLGCDELLLVVFLEGRAKFLHEAGFGDGQGLDVCIRMLVSGFEGLSRRLNSPAMTSESLEGLVECQWR